MEMQVKWSKKSRYKLESAVEQCRKTFGDRVALHFYEQVLYNNNRLATHPCIGKAEPLLAHKSLPYRSLVVHEYYKIIYYITGEVIRVANFWDTRCDPVSLADNIR